MAGTTSKSAAQTAKMAAEKPARQSAAKPLGVAKKAAAADGSGIAPKLVKVAAPTVSGPDLKKKELIDLVSTRSGIKKKDAKPVIEAMLAILGETIGSGREFNLPPLGKLRINRTEDKANGRVIVCKLRQASGAAKTAKDPLAEPSE